MKNWDFYEEDVRAYEARFAIVDGKITGCSNGICCFCDFDNEDNDPTQCWDKRLEFLYQEHKEPAVLTDDEKALCKLLGRGWIVRYKDNRLFWSNTKPVKDRYNMWNFKNCKEFHSISLGMYPNCKFDFIKWEDKEPWEVKVDD